MNTDNTLGGAEPSLASDGSQPAGWAVELARKFHETYERLAPQYGYETRRDTREFDPSSPNGRLMCAVIESIGKPALSDAEREAIERASRNGWACDGYTLRMLLERLS